VSSGSDESARLERYLIEQGAEPDELREAAETGTLGTLALELALRPPGERIPFAEAVARADLEPHEAAKMWRALGFPDPLHSPVSLTESQIDSLRILAAMRGALGEETTLQLARTIAGAVAQIAEALVDAFRLNVEMPRRAAGDPYPEIVADYSSTTAMAIPALGQAITDALRSHLVAVSGSTWGLDPERATVTRERTVGFADLVGYTASARHASPAELAATVTRFERHVSTAAADHGGRIVKLIGDEAMFVVGDPLAGCELALELRRAIAEDPELPAVRIGVAAGPVVSHRGDYYGDVVNLAARLVKLAEPGAVLVSEGLAEAGSGSSGLVFEPTGDHSLKGYEDRVGAYRLGSPPL
jgi:adenylate cyclase